MRRALLLGLAIASLLGCDEAILQHLQQNEKPDKQATPEEKKSAGEDASEPADRPAAQHAAADSAGEQKAGPENEPLPDAYMGARLGAERKKVLARFKRAYHRVEGRTFMFGHHLKGRPQQDLRFHFLDDRLYMIQHVFKEENAGNARAQAAKLVEQLTRRYGKPKRPARWSDGERDLAVLVERERAVIRLRLSRLALTAESYLGRRRR